MKIKIELETHNTSLDFFPNIKYLQTTSIRTVSMTTAHQVTVSSNINVWQGPYLIRFVMVYLYPSKPGLFRSVKYIT